MDPYGPSTVSCPGHAGRPCVCGTLVFVRTTPVVAHVSPEKFPVFVWSPEVSTLSRLVLSDRVHKAPSRCLVNLFFVLSESRGLSVRPVRPDWCVSFTSRETTPPDAGASDVTVGGSDFCPVAGLLGC